MIAHSHPTVNSCRLLGGLLLFAVQVLGAGQFQIWDAAEFNKIIDTNNAVLTTNATVSLGSSTILEGPTWVPGNPGYLIFSAFQNGTYSNTNAGLRKLVLPTAVSTNLAPPAYTVYNGSTLDMQERFVSCQSGSAGLCVVMITNNPVLNSNVVTTLVSTCNGRKFYSPNDVVVKSDGTIWFTDPGFNSGIAFSPSGSIYTTNHNVYRFNPTNGNATCTAVLNFPGTGSSSEPNGLCFSPNESLFYLADWGNNRILVYSVSPSNTLSGGSVFANITNGAPDGIRCDADGRIYSSSGDGIYVFMPYPDGHLIGRITTPNGVNNLCFGGTNWSTLFIASAPSILSIPLKVPGANSIRKLTASVAGNNLSVLWPAPSTGFKLQASDFLGGQSAWIDLTNSPQVTNGLNQLSLPATNGAQFFRLHIN
jgi:gluconolactonase